MLGATRITLEVLRGGHQPTLEMFRGYQDLRFSILGSSPCDDGNQTSSQFTVQSKPMLMYSLTGPFLWCEGIKLYPVLLRD